MPKGKHSNSCLPFSVTKLFFLCCFLPLGFSTRHFARRTLGNFAPPTVSICALMSGIGKCSQISFLFYRCSRSQRKTSESHPLWRRYTLAMPLYWNVVFIFPPFLVCSTHFEIIFWALGFVRYGGPSMGLTSAINGNVAPIDAHVPNLLMITKILSDTKAIDLTLGTLVRCERRLLA